MQTRDRAMKYGSCRTKPRKKRSGQPKAECTGRTMGRRTKHKHAQEDITVKLIALQNNLKSEQIRK